jgi:hypothetical protein
MIRTNKAAWREIGGKKHYFKSIWEANYARYLQWKKEKGEIKEWHYEPKDFWFEDIKRGVRSYKPDFLVEELNETSVWYEVKGFYDARSLTKIKRFRKYYPLETLFLIDSEWFNSYGKMYGSIMEWETVSGIRKPKTRKLTRI